MKESIIAYYIAEKQEAVFMALSGFCIVVLTTFLFVETTDDFFIGIAYSVFPLAVLQLLSGCRNLLFHKQKRERILQVVKKHPKKAAQIEKVRTLNAQIRLRFYKIGEQLLLLIGLILLISGGVFNLGVFLAGSGCGLLLMTAILFVQDLFSEWRSGIYLSELQTFIDEK